MARRRRDKRLLGKWERLAAERQLRDLETGGERGLVWREDLAARAIYAIGQMRLWKGKFAGQPIPLLDWQAELVLAPLHGWYWEDGTRRFRRGHIEVPRKAGKTTLMATIGLYRMAGEGEPGGQVYSGATKLEQAKLIFRDALEVAKKTPVLRERIETYKESIVHPGSGSFFQPLGANHHSLDGLDVYCALIDELHEHGGRGLYDKLVTAVGARQNPLVLTISTAGYDDTSLWYETREYTRQVLDGTVTDDAFFGFVAAADDEDRDHWQDPRIWGKANPSLGHTVYPHNIEDLVRSAQGKPKEICLVRRYYLNLMEDEAEKEIEPSSWDRCYLPVDQWPDLSRIPPTLAIDLASVFDLAAIGSVTPADGKLYVRADLWTTTEMIAKRAAEGKPQYRQWHEQGWLHATDGSVISTEEMAVVIRRYMEELGARELCYDPWNALDFMSRMEREVGIQPIEIRQTFAGMSHATKLVLAAIHGGTLVHDGNPVLRWNFLNVACDRDPNDNVKPNKKKSGSRVGNKIDGAVAVIMGAGRATAALGDSYTIYAQAGQMRL